MADVSNPTEIACELKPAHQKAVISARPFRGGEFRLPLGAGRDLAPLGLATHSRHGMVLTPLGLAVHAILQSAEP